MIIEQNDVIIEIGKGMTRTEKIVLLMQLMRDKQDVWEK